VRPERENSSEEHGERRKSDSVSNELKLNLGKNGGKIEREKKVRKSNVENIKKQHFFYAREGEIKSVFYANKSMIVLVYKESYFNANDLDSYVYSVAVKIFQVDYHQLEELKFK